jgi:hypothetical protein
MSRYNYRNNTAGVLDSDHIYYNINYTNAESGSSIDESGNIVQLPTDRKDLVFNFNQSRAAPYIQCPEDYYLSVIRFTIESPNLPLFTVQPIQGLDSDITIYTVTIMGTDGNPFKRQVRWTPEDSRLADPGSPSTYKIGDPIDPYYYCYSYAYFITCVNDALAYCWATELGENILNSPYVYFDVETNLFTLGGPVDFFRTNNNGEAFSSTFSIYFNIPLYNLLASLPAKYVSKTITVTQPGKDNSQMDYRMILSTGSSLPPGDTQPYIINTRNNPYTANLDVYATQEYSTLPLWTPITSIVFKTSLLTTNPEIIGTPVVYVDGTRNINAGRQNADILNTLSEHSVDLKYGTEYKPFIYYEPSGEFKLTDLYGKNPIQDIDISVFWKDNFGNLIPFRLGIGCSSTIKILFRKKTFNSDKLD